MKRNLTDRTAKRMIMIASSLLILTVLFSSFVAAIGVAPSRKVVDFEPGEVVKYSIDIVNNGREDLEIMVYPKGEFTDNVKISRQVFSMSSDDASGPQGITVFLACS